MKRRSFLLGALIAPLVAALRLGGEQLKFPAHGGGIVEPVQYWHGKPATHEMKYSDEFLDALFNGSSTRHLHSELIAIKRSGVYQRPAHWYAVGDVVEIEGTRYEVTNTEIRKERFGYSDIYIGDAYLREIKEELAPKAEEMRS